MKETPFLCERQTAIAAARRAGAYLKAHQHLAVIERIKSGPNDYATAQDLGAEKLILDTIRERFPTDAILSEESHTQPSAGERLWVIDPLDGTRNYANGLRHFAVSIAFCHRDRAVAGVVYVPCDGDELFWAERDQGAFLNDAPLQMAAPSASLASSLVATGFAYHLGAALHPHVATLEKVMNAATDVLRFGSAATDICYVAAGRFGAYYESGLKPWDVAAASLIVQEAGGMVSDVSGAPLDLFARNQTTFCLNVLVAKSAGIHRQMADLIGRPSYPTSPLDNT
ncbi:inositol monophosphatase family protein [Anaerobaca lacustris]|uniref:Inositol-1-monophosphatase n=1 Tax=Anaerobaca lacustris TaxID=3044600 RepID=A0AAW6TZM2_9BACT|nr:inositol monophosphatase family protein [Sedimentisphaerales bacterium M17dextr]